MRLSLIQTNRHWQGRALAAFGAVWLVFGCGSAPGTIDTEMPAGNADLRVDISACPLIGSLSAQPLRTRVGDDIALSASSSDTSDAAALSFVWYASSGTFLDATSASTTYVCDRVGNQNIFLVVNNGICGDLAEVPIVCDNGEQQ